MSIISLDFMQRFQSKLDSAIKAYVKKKNVAEKGSAILADTDLNNLTTVGTYYIENDTVASSILHLPLSLCGKVIVTDNGNNGIVQFYIPNHSPRLFQRLYWSSAWSEWREYEQGSSSAVYLTQTLTAGSTTVTFTDDRIAGNSSYIDIYSKAGLDYTAIDNSVANTVVLTYEPQQSDVTVVLKIEGG